MHLGRANLSSSDRRESPMGMRRRTRRRGLVAGAVVGGAVAHHRNKQFADQQPVDDSQGQYAPAPADPADEIEHLAQLHSSGALTDAEFASAKAKVLGS